MKFLSLIALLSLIYSCSEEVQSKPNYVFKDGDKNLAAKVFGEQISKADLIKGIESDIYAKEMEIFDLKFNKLKSIVMEKIMAKDPKSKGLTNDEYLDKFIASNLKVTEKDVKAFVAERNIPSTHMENKQFENKVREYIKMERRKEAVEAWIAKETKSNPVEIYFKKPKRPTFDVQIGNAPSFGGKDAKVEIVEFSDFQCPHCANGAKVVSELKKKYGNKIKFAFKQYPLPFHRQAKTASVAALCVNEQSTEKFWKYHDLLFADQSKLAITDLKATAKKVGVKTEQFDKCLDNKKYLDQVESDIAEGRDIGVKSTPTFFINGQIVQGALPVQEFSEIIDSELN